MNKAVRSILFLLILTCHLYSQKTWYRYNWDSINRKSFPDMLNYVYNFDLNYYKDNIYVGQYHKAFAARQAKYAESNVNHGYFYLFKEYDSYLRKILEKTIPDTSLTNKIKIFVTKESEHNASMDGSGILRLQIGDIAWFDTESEIAATFGHEVSHFINHDAIKDFGQDLERQFNPGFSFWLAVQPPFSSRPIFIVEPFSEHLWFSRTEESAADFLALKFIMKSPYSTNGMVNKFKKWKRDEIRNQIRFGEAQEKDQTHPDPGNRMKQVNSFSNDSLNKGKKDFVVDSVTFFKFKSIAKEEVINIDMEQCQWDEVIEATFKTYLFEPNNLNNLAVLIEALRRLMLFDEKYKIGEESFILSGYQTRHIKDSKTYAFLNEKKPSILKYLFKGLIDIGKKDLSQIKATELLDTTKIAFTTYSEAYEYFKLKAKEKNCLVCEHYKFFEKSIDTAFAQTYQNLEGPFDTKAYVEQIIKPSSTSNSLFVILPTTLSKTFHIFDMKSFSEKEKFYDTIVDIVKSKVGDRVFKLYDLPYYEQHQLIVLLGLGSYFLNLKENVAYLTDKTDWRKYAPELCNFFARNNIKNLYVIDVNLYLGKEKKSFQDYSFFKISLPGKKNNSFCASVKTGQQDLDPTYSWFYKKVATEFDYFYKLAK